MSTSLDTKVIGKLAEILDRNNLNEIEYEDEGCRICLSRNSKNIAPAPAATIYHQAPAIVSAQPSAAEQIETKSAVAADEDYAQNPNTIKSPMVGVVYLSPDPNSPNYVKVGDTVKEGDIVCLIEAMKTFNPVKAHKSGIVVKVLVEGGDPVEFGEPLVVLE